MGFAELQIDETTFLAILQVAASAAPNPFPTFDFLPSGQLIRALHWGGQASYGAPGIAAAPGQLIVSMTVKATHLSIDELAADAAAAGTNLDTTFVCTVGMVDTGLDMSVVRIDVGSTKHVLPSPVSFVRTDMAGQLGPPGQTLTVAGGAVLHSTLHKMVVLRIATTQGAVATVNSAALIDHRDSNNWAIFISKSVLTSSIEKLLKDQLAAKLPAKIQVEDPPQASWTHDSHGWGIDATVGLLAIDACPALIGSDVDMSIELDMRLEIHANLTTKNLDLKLHADHDASDWDSFRCILQNIGSALLVYLGIPFTAQYVPLAIWELFLLPFIIPPLINSLAGSSVSDQEITGFTKQKTPDDGDDATFTQSQPLPRLPGTIPNTAVVSSIGVIVRGPAPFLLPVLHRQDLFVPLEPKLVDSMIPGDWYSEFSCNTKTWDASYLLGTVSATDTLLSGNQVQGNAKIQLFYAEVRPATLWSVDQPFGPLSAFPLQLHVTANDDPPTGSTGTLFVHSSAGLSRIDIQGTPAPPTPPSAPQLIEMAAQCAQAAAPWQAGGHFDPHWSVDPYPWERGAFYNWVFRTDTLQKGAAIEITRASESMRVTGAGQPVIVELVTDASDRLTVSVQGHAVAGAIDQRLLVPLRHVEINSPIHALQRTGGGRIAVLTARELLTLRPDGGVLTRAPSGGATALASDENGLLAWGPTGAFRMTGGALVPIVEHAVHAAQRHSGQLVLHTAHGQRAVDGLSVVAQPGAQIRPSAATTIGLRYVWLGGGRVVIAHGQALIVAQQDRFRRDVGPRAHAARSA